MCPAVYVWGTFPVLRRALRKVLIRGIMYFASGKGGEAFYFASFVFFPLLSLFSCFILNLFIFSLAWMGFSDARRFLFVEDRLWHISNVKPAESFKDCHQDVCCSTWTCPFFVTGQSWGVGQGWHGHYWLHHHINTCTILDDSAIHMNLGVLASLLYGIHKVLTISRSNNICIYNYIMDSV